MQETIEFFKLLINEYPLLFIIISLLLEYTIIRGFKYIFNE